MPGYVQKLLQRFNHKKPSRPQRSTYRAPSKIYGSAAQDTIPTDTTTEIDGKRVLVIQQVIGDVLYYVRALDLTVLPGLSSIASEQTNARENTEKKVKQLLDYLETHPNDVIRYHASSMVLNIHPDA